MYKLNVFLSMQALFRYLCVGQVCFNLKPLLLIQFFIKLCVEIDKSESTCIVCCSTI